jgi:hypothetical protein
LLEESRRDNPLLRNRIDREADAMSQPAETQFVLDAIINQFIGRSTLMRRI